MAEARNSAIRGEMLTNMIGRYTAKRGAEKESMGLVFQGRYPYIKSPAAIKIPLSESTLPENQLHNYRNHFFAEARTSGSLISLNTAT